MIAPTRRLAELVEEFGARLSLFVDAGYLCRLQASVARFPRLEADLDLVTTQLKDLASRGHDIQLHIHPHWEDCSYDGKAWQIDVSRFKLQDHPAEHQVDIVARYKRVLEGISPNPVFAYRAGGWCIQPFNVIREALRRENVWLDSTLFAGGVSEDQVNGFDFRDMPASSTYRFSDDPLIEDAGGFFLEVPISSYPLRPRFYWEMALRKKFGGASHLPAGDGVVKGNSRGYYLSRLLSSSVSPVSVDGVKSRIVAGAYAKYLREGASGVFNVMGHPKSLTPFSYQQVSSFLSQVSPGAGFITFQDLRFLEPAGSMAGL